MSGIFGIFQRDGTLVEPATLETMRQVMSQWGPDGSNVWSKDSIGLGQALFFNSSEAYAEQQPCVDPAGDLVLTVASRVDNRSELLATLNISDQPSIVSDGDLIRYAYRHWGEDCVTHIYGDWAFAAWQPTRQQLFLARDHFGMTALYYYLDPRIFAFASSRQALLALNFAPIELDELYLAQVLISWPAYHGERTIHTPIRRLPPAHCLTVTPEKFAVRQYWRLEDTPPLLLRRREDYVAAFREVFDEAVRVRLRLPDRNSASERSESAEKPASSTRSGTNCRIAVSLSGGLDSSSVTATAARFLRNTDQNLIALTSVPLSDTRHYVGTRRFGDELPFAEATARFTGNVILRPITATNVSPIQAIRQVLQVHNEPSHAACNYYWMLEVRLAARAQGCRVLLNGQIGNASISWAGSVFSQPLAFQLRQLGWRRWSKEWLKRTLPPHLYTTLQRRRMDHKEWYRSSAIRPDFARRLNLLEQRLTDPDERPARTPLEQRRFIMPGRSLNGALHAQLGAAYGIELRDPTADARVLAFTFSVPDHVFIDPETGLDRWLIREAMKGRLPDEVRLNRRRGRQAGDLVPRLRACANEVEVALDELARGPAAAYVDVPYMRQVWQTIQTQDTPEAFHKAITILTRGIMAGLFVNGFQ